MDENKNLSGEEKRQKMKEEYKRELLERKKFLDKANQLRSQKKINEALSNMSVDDDTDDWISKLNEETAFVEARAELAMDSVETQQEEIDAKQKFAQSEEELQKISAKKLVEEMKRAMRGETLEEEPTDEQKEGEEQKEEKEVEKPKAEKKKKPKKDDDSLGDF